MHPYKPWNSINPPHPTPPPPKPPIPIPTPITIRLITDPAPLPPFPLPHPGPPLPLSPIIEPRPRHRTGPPLPPPAPDSIISRPRRRGKSDQFYRAWDRFTLQKQRGRDEKERGRHGKKTKDDAERPGPSLDTDVEGLPGHKVGMNEEGVESSQNAATSYEEAAASCRDKVEAIVRECKRLNQKYYDRLFNLPDWDTLVHLGAEEQPQSVKDLLGVGAVKRIEDIFDEPEFFEEDEGPTGNEIRQGNVGDCWFLAALTALSGKPELIKRLCVARDERVGVYGFVFFRDGEWISEVIDDRLCLRYADDLHQYPTDYLVLTRGDKNALAQPLNEMSYAVQRLPKDFSQSLRKGSNALYFGSCRESNETWLPLIEKAYAKAHGDYQAIDGGVTGEGIEDLTGGVASYIRSENVLDKDKLWAELMQVNDKFLFGCGTRKGRDSESADDEGFVRGHAYTVLAAREIDAPQYVGKKKKTKKQKEEDEKLKKQITKEGKLRLLKLHNPWGSQEWNGQFSDGSKELTPEILKELDHVMGNDGTFYITFADFLTFYPVIDRIRLIGSEWTVTQQWTAVNVPWTTDYLETSFKVTITKPGPVVLVLSQPDTRYFKGMTGRYKYSIHFRLYKEDVNTYILRSMEQSGNMRSCNAEVELEPGTYELLLKITAERWDEKRTPDQIVREYRDDRREKLLAVGKSFDLTHSKGKLRELERQNVIKERRDDRRRRHENMAFERVSKRKNRAKDKARQKRIYDEIERKREEKRKMAKEKMKKKREEAMEREKEEREKAVKAHQEAKEQRRQRRAKRQAKKEEKSAKPTDKGNDASQESTKEGDESSTKQPEHAEKPVDASQPVEKPVDAVASAESEPVSESTGTITGSSEDESSTASEDQAPTGTRPIDVPQPHIAEASSAADHAPAVGGSDKPKEADAEQATEDDKAVPPEKLVYFAGQDIDSKKTEPKAEILPKEHKSKRRYKGDHPKGKRRDDPNIREDQEEFYPPPEPHFPPSRHYPPPPHHGRFHPGPPRGPPGDVVIIDRPHRMPNGMPMGRPMPHQRRMSGDSMGSDGVPFSPVSSVCDEDFSWDSDIDGPVSSLASDESSAEDSADDMYNHDPWQATCVIGLRVCSLDENASIEVVRGSNRRNGKSEIAMGRARSPA